MRDLDPEDIDKLITIRGMITRTSSVIPDLKKGKHSFIKRHDMSRNTIADHYTRCHIL